jgi:uncharacterized protein YndB with AHSA1/START domain
VTVVAQESIDLDAPVEAVWAVLVDVERWPEWTASVRSVRRSRTGPLTVGERVVLEQPRLPRLIWTVTQVVPERSFTWTAGSAVARGVGEHVLTPRRGGGCTATLRVRQTGPAGPLVAALLRGLTRRYVRTEAEGLRTRVTRSGPAAPAG